MKKLFCVLMTIVMLFSFAACGKNEAPQTEPATIDKAEETTSDTYSGEEEDDWLLEPYYPQEEEIDEDSLYYQIETQDYLIEYEGNDEVLNLLAGFCAYNYIGAGSGYREVYRYIDFMILAQKDETKWESIPVFLDTLTAVQLDYLSFRVHHNFKNAQNVIERDNFTMSYVTSMDVEPEDYWYCTTSQLLKFTSYILGLLYERGVENEWERIGGEFYFYG